MKKIACIVAIIVIGMVLNVIGLSTVSAIFCVLSGAALAKKWNSI